MSAFPYTYEILDVARLFVDSSYQRELTSLHRRIEANFDPALVGTLVVSDRGEDGYAIVDGQTRAAAIAALVARDEARCGIPCLVYRGLTRADEARLFARLQKERRGIASFHRFRADLVAGEPEAVAIADIVKRVGYDIGTPGGKCISAVAALERVYRRGPQLLERALVICRTAWAFDQIPKGDVLRGLGLLLSQETIDDLRMAEALADETLGSLERAASVLREGASSGSGAESYMADALRNLYFAERELAA